MGPLSFEFSVGTSLKLGGRLSADLARNPPKSFGEELGPGETMALEGGLSLEGSASVSVSAGLAVGVSALIANLLSADLKLTGELGAEFQTELTGSTAFGLENEKLKQAKDLELHGDLGVTLKGALNLSSDVKFLIWKANIFTLELAQKELALARVSGTVTREVGAKGLKNGWHFESLELSAEAFGKKAGLALNGQGEGKREPVRISQAAVDALGRDAMDTWAVLEDLKQQQTLSEDRLYFMSEQEREELKEEIKRVSKEAEDKLRVYTSYLASYQTQLGQDKKRAEQAIAEARAKQADYQQKDEVRGVLLRQSRIGGFDPENYRNAPEKAPLSEEEMADIRAKNTNLKANSLIRAENRDREQSNRELREKNRQLNKMGAVDLAIARQLGIYDDAMAQVRDAYDLFAEGKNRELKAKDRDLPKEKLYRKSSELTEREFLFGDLGAGWGKTTEQMLESMTRFGSGSQNYYDSLYTYAINESDGRDLKGFGFYHKAFRTGPGNKEAFTNMSGYDLLKVILTDTYPENACDYEGNKRGGRKMGGTPDQKLEALTHLFKNKEKNTLDSLLNKLLLDYEQKKTRQEAMMEDTNDVYKALFDSTLEQMTARGSVDIPRKLDELKQNLEESKQAYLQAIQDELDVEATMKKVEAERADCLTKLEKLRRNVKAGVALDGRSVAGATGAVDFMEQDYQEIVSGRRLLEAASENAKAQQALRRGGATG